MELLKMLESIRTPFWNEVFNAITWFGDEILILAVAFFVLWCFGKRMGYSIIYSVLLGVTVNQFLKGIFCVPRPWVRDPSFTIVESARASATGYSFPSGHTQNSTVLFGSIARNIRTRAFQILLVFLILLVGFSRMYLGVHTPADVLTSWIIGTCLVFALHPLMKQAEKNRIFGLFLNLFFLALAIILVIFAEKVPVGMGETAVFAADGVKNAYTILGITAAFPMIWYIDLTKLRYEVKAVWWSQILKCTIGMILIMAIRIGLKPVLFALTDGHEIGTAIRYFLIAVFGGLVWPLTFRFWSKLGRSGLGINPGVTDTRKNG